MSFFSERKNRNRTYAPETEDVWSPAVETDLRGASDGMSSKAPLKCSEAYLTGIADSPHKKQKVELLLDEKSHLYAYRSFSSENKTAVRALIGLLSRRQKKQNKSV